MSLLFRSSTQTVEKDLSPEWDETFEFAVKDFTRVLEIEVLDADVVVDESMGSFTIKLEDLLHKRRVRIWFSCKQDDRVGAPVYWLCVLARIHGS